jgi:hypothetical protein
VTASSEIVEHVDCQVGEGGDDPEEVEEETGEGIDRFEELRGRIFDLASLSFLKDGFLGRLAFLVCSSGRLNIDCDHGISEQLVLDCPELILFEDVEDEEKDSYADG